MASICSVWSSACLCLGEWWGWSFSSSGTAAGCLSWEVWWLRTGSMGWAILLSAKSCCRLSWEQWLCPLYLLGLVLLGCCWLQLTSLSSMIVLQPPFLCEGWGGHPLCVPGDSSVLMDLNWPCGCTAQCGILSTGTYLLFFCEAFSWTILDRSSFSLFHSGQVFHELVCCLDLLFMLSILHFHSFIRCFLFHLLLFSMILYRSTVHVFSDHNCAWTLVCFGLL